MTQGEWNGCTEPQGMLEFLRGGGRVSERKWRLLCCGCCRRVWRLLTDERHRAAVAVAERLADGEVTPEEGQAIADASYTASFSHMPYEGCAAHLLVRHLSSFNDWDETYRCPPLDNTEMVAEMLGEDLREEERVAQAALARDVFGPLPFRRVAIAPSLLERHDDLIVKLAQAAYDGRILPSGHLDPARLSILADALLDAGCPADHELLLHLRGEGPHVRGCFAVDVLLGKE